MKRSGFGSTLGIVLATAGSAVGLGNVWRFPYMAGENGGAAFVVIYMGCILLLGVPGMVSEFIVGRHAQANAPRAYDKLSGGRPWRLVGYLGIFTSTVILGFYAVVAGWCLQYLFASMAGQLNGDAAYVKDYFATFSSSSVKPVVLGVVFILITHLVVARGIRKGIEQTSKLLMPVLFVLLLLLVVASCLLPGAMRGVEFLLRPDFSEVTSDTFLDALGQAFFSVSLGAAVLCTYASYFSKTTNLVKSSVQIVLIDTLVAVLSGLMIFPAAFSVGVQPDSGPSLIFITLPNVFQQAFAAMPAVGYVVSIMFYVLLVFAALTSTISMHEIGTAFFTEELHMSRSRSAWLVTAVASLLCVICALSVGAMPDLQLMGLSVMDFCDLLTANALLPVGGLMACLFVGWFVPRQVVADEFTNQGTVNRRFYRAYLFAVRYVCPLLILAIFLHQLGVL